MFNVEAQFQKRVYQVGTKEGLLKGWFPRTYIPKSGTSIILLDDVPTNTLLNLRQVDSKQSISGSQWYKNGNCKPAKNRVQTKRCACFEAGITCNYRRYYLSSPCYKK